MQVANKDQHLTLLPNSFFYSRSIWFREISREKKNKDLRNFEKKNNLISIVDHFEGRMGISNWFQHKFSDPLLLVLRGGVQPKQLAFSTALGITLGVFPICGTTVFLCGIAITLLGSFCNAPTMLVANLIATPIELSLVIPFLRFGEIISGGTHFPLTSDALKKVLTGQASSEVLLSIAHALLGWLVASPFILGTLYMVLLPCFKVLVHKFSSAPSSPEMPLLPLLPHPEVGLKVRDI